MGSNETTGTTLIRMQAVKALTSRMLHKHYCENDVESIVALFDRQMSWFGAGKAEYAVGPRRVAEIFRQFKGKIPPCRISGEEYDVQPVSQEIYLCTGRLWITTDPSSHMCLRVHQRISALFRWEGQGPRCCHLHISNPYTAMSDGEIGFPSKIGQQSYEYLQECIAAQNILINAQAAELESIYHTVPCGIMRLLRTEQGYRLLTFNRALAELAGCPDWELRQQDWSQGYCGALDTQDGPRLRSALAQLKQPGDQVSVDYRIVNQQRRRLYLTGINSLISVEPEGAIIQRIVFDISRRMELEEKLKQMSYEDALTGLFNRNMFNLVLEGTERGESRRLGVACFDLNGLKMTNDTLGHSAGDELICRTARHIRRWFEGKAYRIGGDEFVVVDEGCSELVFRTGVAGVYQSLEEDGISVSVGLSWRESGCSVKEQFDAADWQMYQAKKRYYAHRQAASGRQGDT